MLNRIVLIGRLTADPELRYTPSGVAVGHFTLAVNRPQNRNGQNEADFIPVVVWNKLAEVVAQYLAKGRMAAVDGRLQIRSYENREGQRVRVAEVVAEQVRFLDYGTQNAQESQKSQENKPREEKRQATKPPWEDPFDDPFLDDSGRPMDISDDDLPF